MSFQYTNCKLNHLKYHSRRRNAELPSTIASTILEDQNKNDYFSQHIKESKEQLFLNVGGIKFKIFKSNFSCFPDTRLSKLVRANNDEESLAYCDEIMYSAQKESKEYFFHRSPQIFNYVLDIYREGTLHSPLGICTIQLKQELRYWGINDELFEPCCALQYHQKLKDVAAQEKRFVNRRSQRMQASKCNQSNFTSFEKVDKPLASINESKGISFVNLVRHNFH